MSGKFTDENLERVARESEPVVEAAMREHSKPLGFMGELRALKDMPLREKCLIGAGVAAIGAAGAWAINEIEKKSERTSNNKTR